MGRIAPSRVASATAWALVRQFSLVSTSCTTFFTVRSEKRRSSAMPRVS